MRSDSLLRMVREGRMEGMKVAGRPRTKLLGWMIRETDNRRYEYLKNWQWTRDRELGISDMSKGRQLEGGGKREGEGGRKGRGRILADGNVYVQQMHLVAQEKNEMLGYAKC